MADSIEKAMHDALNRKGQGVKTNYPSVIKGKVQILNLRIPMIRRVETTAEKREVLDKAVAEVRQYIAAIPDHMSDLVARVETINGVSHEERAIRANEFKELESEVLTHLNSEEEILRSAARWAYAKALVANAKPSRWNVLAVLKGRKLSELPGLINLGIAAEVVGEPEKNKASAKIYGATYIFNGRRDEASALAESLKDLATRSAAIAREYWGGVVDGIEDQATEKNPLQLREDVAGRFAISVPDDKSGEKVLLGGILLVESDGKNVKILQAAGHFQRIMEEIRDAGTFVAVSSLSEDRLPFIPDKELFWRVRILHAVLRRGLEEAEKEAAREKRAADFKAKADTEREALMAKTTVSAAEWLFNGAPGSAVIYLGRKPWMIADRKTKNETPYFDVFFLVERDGDGKVRLAEYPERLEPLFRSQFSKFVKAGERFEGLKYPLGSMLRITFAYEKAKTR